MKSEEQKTRYNAANRERYATDPEYRKKQNTSTARYMRERYANDPEFREKRKEATRKRYAEIKERCSNDPEFQERMRTYRREYRARKRRSNQTVFDRITQSEETLAEKLVYRYDGNNTWRSFLLYGYEFLIKSEAIAATVAKLKEVCK